MTTDRDAERALDDLLAGRLGAGVYQWRAPVPTAWATVEGPDWRDRAAKAGWRTFTVDAGRVRDGDGFLKLCGEAFDLPEWYGENWDALQDCLTDLSWAPARHGYLVLWERWTGLAEDDQKAFRTALDVFAEAVEWWRDTGTPMAVLVLPTPGLEVAGIPRLAPRPADDAGNDSGPDRRGDPGR
ncbi:barstar family protein [Actinomadura kijaniata]|uniref:barstar family protein n=1 Tax=Actinomadura kijaniata TaxID=46161 RepID=UPI003F1E23D4